MGSWGGNGWWREKERKHYQAWGDNRIVLKDKGGIKG